MLASPTYLQLRSHIEGINNYDFTYFLIGRCCESFILFIGVVRVHTRHGLIAIVNCAV